MGDEQGDRSTPVDRSTLYWLIYQSDQLEEVGVLEKGLWKPLHRKKRVVAFGGSPKIKGSIGLLIEQRVKHFGIAFAVDVRIPAPTSGSDAGLRSVSIKIALSFHPALPPHNSFIIKLHADTFDEESPETTLFPWLSPLLLPPSKTLFSFVLAYFSPASYITVVFFLLHIFFLTFSSSFPSWPPC